MTTTLSTASLVPLIENLSQNLTAIASILKAETEIAIPADIAGEAETKKPEVKKPKNMVDSSAGSSEESKPVITIEQVRAILAEKSQAGLTLKVKELLQSFGSEKLSGIDPARYGDLIEAARALQ